MLSIIICSRSKLDFEGIKENIAQKIGIIHEVIQIDNSNNAYSISQAYNAGGSQSKFPFLCFLHEDVVFSTQNWGELLVNILANKSVGLVGVAGAIMKTKATGPNWWSTLEK